MRFIITSAGNNSAVGELMFTNPTELTQTKAEIHITERCYKELKIRKLQSKAATFRLEQELITMHREGLLFQLWALEIVAKVSAESGFPVIPHGTLGGSLAAYLLGLSPVNPLEWNLPFAVVWQKPVFEIAIAPTVRDSLHRRLDMELGHLAADHQLFQEVTMVDSLNCQRLGHLAEKHRFLPGIADFDEQVCTRVAHSFARFSEDDKSWLGESADCIAKELAALPRCDFGMLIRIWGFLKGSLHERRSLTDLNDPHYLVLRDELFRELLDCRMAELDAANFVYRGIRQSREKTRAYLKSYPVPEYVWTAIDSADYLWPKHACISRLYEPCALAWYELNESR